MFGVVWEFFWDGGVRVVRVREECGKGMMGGMNGLGNVAVGLVCG